MAAWDDNLRWRHVSACGCEVCIGHAHINRLADDTLAQTYFDADGNEGTLDEVYS